MPRGNAEAVFESTKKRLIADGITAEQLAGFGSDGASVFSGSKNGVMKLIRAIFAYCFTIHCVCHRQALAAADAAKRVPYLKRMFDIIEALGRHYSWSPTRSASLRETLVSMYGGGSTKVTKSATTRWLTHDQVTAMLWACLTGILEDLDSRGEGDAAGAALPADLRTGTADVKSAGFHAFMFQREFICMLALARDVLPVMAGLSRKMQGRSVDFTVLETEIPSAIQKIEDMVESPGPHWKAREAKIEEVERELGKRVPLGHPSHNDRWLQSWRKKFLMYTVEHMRERFPGVPTLASLHRILNTASYPASADAGPDEICDHLKGDLDLVAEHFSKPFQADFQGVSTSMGGDSGDDGDNGDEQQGEEGGMQRFSIKAIKDEFKAFCKLYATVCRSFRLKHLKEVNSDRERRLAAFKIAAKKVSGKKNTNELRKTFFD